MSAHPTPTNTTPDEKGFFDKYPRFFGWFMFWCAVTFMALLVIPKKDIDGTTLMVLVMAVIVMAINSAMRDTGTGAWDTAVRVAKFIFVLCIVSFFLPNAPMVASKKINELNTWIAQTPSQTTTPPYMPRDERNVIRATTPTEISTNFEFNLEANQDILVTYEDGQWYIHKHNSGGCQQAPIPRSLGPKKFTDPNNPNGNIPFRIYRLRPGEGTCNQ